MDVLINTLYLIRERKREEYSDLIFYFLFSLIPRYNIYLLTIFLWNVQRPAMVYKKFQPKCRFLQWVWVITNLVILYWEHCSCLKVIYIYSKVKLTWDCQRLEAQMAGDFENWDFGMIDQKMEKKKKEKKEAWYWLSWVPSFTEWPCSLSQSSACTPMWQNDKCNNKTNLRLLGRQDD